MSVSEQKSLLPIYFVLSDSHSKFVPPSTTTSSHKIIVKSISGLSWLNKYNSHLSAIYQIETTIIASHISSSKSILLLIGTNSIRSSPAAVVINQVKNFVLLLRDQHPHLVDKSSINIVRVFPCRKTSFSFPTCESLQQNIDFYNEQLVSLSHDFNFAIVDFQIEHHYLGPDNLHIHFNHREIVKNSIFNYFDSLTSQSSSSTIRSNKRSATALAERTQHKHEKLDEKQKLLQIKRKITTPWTLNKVKEFLKQKKIEFAKLPPIHNNVLPIRFNNSISLEKANKTLSQDIFSEETFFRSFSL